MKIAVALNGPPGSGKDTIADIMAGWGWEKHEFKDHLYLATAWQFNCDVDELRRLATDRTLKELPCDLGNGLSPRQMLIETSEVHVKPSLGKDYFGKAAAQRIGQSRSDRIVFSDGGFAEELMPVSEVVGMLLVVRLFRQGRSFEGDSRRYLAMSDVPSRNGWLIQVENVEGAVDATAKEIMRWARHFEVRQRERNKLRDWPRSTVMEA